MPYRNNADDTPRTEQSHCQIAWRAAVFIWWIDDGTDRKGNGPKVDTIDYVEEWSFATAAIALSNKIVTLR